MSLFGRVHYLHEVHGTYGQCLLVDFASIYTSFENNYVCTSYYMLAREYCIYCLGPRASAVNAILPRDRHVRSI